MIIFIIIIIICSLMVECWEVERRRGSDDEKAILLSLHWGAPMMLVSSTFELPSPFLSLSVSSSFYRPCYLVAVGRFGLPLDLGRSRSWELSLSSAHEVIIQAQPHYPFSLVLADLDLSNLLWKMFLNSLPVLSYQWIWVIRIVFGSRIYSTHFHLLV